MFYLSKGSKLRFWRFTRQMLKYKRFFSRCSYHNFPIQNQQDIQYQYF